ncbi:MAG: hypothetical protein JKY93_11755, partial [Gammaproteobacteria bacterium]|nr:hypothetical protein [Gammaproteobacteria bacterium]
NDVITGSSADDVIIGGTGIDVLKGGAGNDVLRGDAGNDFLAGGIGDDNYQFGRQHGADTLVEFLDQGTDRVSFLNDIAADQLWFKQTGNDLDVSIIGTDDHLKVRDWYSADGPTVESFATADGAILYDNQVQQLVDAMAAFAPPASGESSLSDDYKTQLDPVIAASWG